MHNPIERHATRFVRYVDTSGGPDACHPWTGTVHPEGYGYVKIDGRKLLAHRVAWELEVDPIPAGAVIDHVCHNGTGCPGGPTCPHRRCCNVRHLEPTTDADNLDRSHNWTGHRTHCRRGGHPLSGANLYVNPTSGKRVCRQCKRDRKRSARLLGSEQ